jgi:hypothetical protein
LLFAREEFCELIDRLDIQPVNIHHEDEDH